MVQEQGNFWDRHGVGHGRGLGGARQDFTSQLRISLAPQSCFVWSPDVILDIGMALDTLQRDTICRH
jgi:hypothetical protein